MIGDNSGAMIQPTYDYNMGGLLPKDLEKSFIDKTLVVGDVKEAHQLLIKEYLTRVEGHALMSYVTSNELKLGNLNDWDRIVLGTYSVRAAQFLTIFDLFTDYFEKVKEAKNESFDIRDDTIVVLTNCYRRFSHYMKKWYYVYNYIFRSALSLKAVAFNAFNSQKFEYEYKGGGLDFSGNSQRPGWSMNLGKK